MDDMLPADPRARRIAAILGIVAALIGTVAVWWLSSYVDSLTALARTDREASLQLFRTRVLPVVGAIVLVAIGAGAWLTRYGLLILRGGEFPPSSARLISPTPRRTGGPARTIGLFLTIAGSLVIACPLVMVAIVLWLLR